MLNRRVWLLVLLVGLVRCGGCEDEPAPGTLVQRITDEAQLIQGVEATGRVGDYLLDNGEIRLVVQEPGSSTGWGLYGGSLVDIDAARPGGNDLLEELFVQCDLRGFAPQTAEIVSNGAGGADGILRLIGNDAGIPFLDAILTRDPLEVTITVDLILPPTGRTFEVRTKVKDERKTRARDIACGFILLPGDAYELSSPDRIRGDVGGRNGYVAASAPDATTSYVIHRPDGATVDVILDDLGIIPIAPDPVPFLANATIEERYFFSIGDRGDLESALAAVRLHTLDLEMRRAVALELVTPRPVDASVLLVDERERAITSVNHVDGMARFEVAPGDYDVIVTLDGYQLGRTPITVERQEGEQAIRLALDTLGTLAIVSRSIGLDGTDEGETPARVRIVEGAGASGGAAAMLQVYAPASVEFVLPAGDYTVVASRGPEHELFVGDVTIVAGQTANVEARIQRSVDTSGWTSADLHVHGTRSADSDVSRRQRVLGAVGEGVDIMVATDHDAVTDYAPTVTELGLDSMLRTAPGIEMSMLYGHINGYPVPAGMPQDHWRPGWFVYDENGRFVRMRDPHEVAETLRTEGAQIVQLNHPRSSTGVFDYLGLDENGETERPWPDVDAVELLNGKRIDEYDDVLVDLFNLLENGRPVTAVGSSDVHSDFGVGYGRTFVRADAELDAVWSALESGHAIASYGPFVIAEIHQGADRAGPGETIVASGPISIDVRVEAPTWMDVTTLEVYENGQSILRRPLTVDDADPMRPALRFSGTVTATPTVDSYYFVEVRGGASPPILGETRATVNAILVDADGDGWSYR